MIATTKHDNSHVDFSTWELPIEFEDEITPNRRLEREAAMRKANFLRYACEMDADMAHKIKYMSLVYIMDKLEIDMEMAQELKELAYEIVEMLKYANTEGE